MPNQLPTDARPEQTYEPVALWALALKAVNHGLLQDVQAISDSRSDTLSTLSSHAFQLW